MDGSTPPLARPVTSPPQTCEGETFDATRDDWARHFHPAVATWFKERFGSPTPAQREGWAAIREGRHVLVAAPTGSGKTLAAFLAALDDLVRLGVEHGLPDACHVLYVSPLKALSVDIEHNLQAPLAGIADVLARRGEPPLLIRTAVRTGDTPARERAAAIRKPPHVMVTTPESLYLLLGSDGGRRLLRTIRTVIVDEIHALAADRRGAHLAISLARLEHLCGRRLVRIGLSATQKPIEEVARFLASGPRVREGVVVGEDENTRVVEAPAVPAPRGRDERDEPPALALHDTPLATFDPATSVRIVDTGHRRALDLAIELPSAPLEAVASHDLWAEVHDRVADLAEQHRTTIVFVNTRALAERTAARLGERLGVERVAAHHGSLAFDRRAQTEARLRSGDLRVVVATASLELGIDVGAIDLVVQIGPTHSIAQLLQRVGRAGHVVGGTPKGRLFPLTRDQLVAGLALVDAIRRGELDALTVPDAPLDVVMQQIVAAVACEEWDEDALFELVRSAWPFRALPRDDFDRCVQVLSEGYGSVRGRKGAHLHRDAVGRRLRPRKGARLTALTSGGTIPETADYEVVLEPEGTRIGSLNEDFAVESTAGDIFQLGTHSWQIVRVEPGKVRVVDAKGQPPNLPFWLGEAPARTKEFSHAVSRLRARVRDTLPDGDELVRDFDAQVDALNATIAEELGLGPDVPRQAIEYLATAKLALGTLPTQDTLVLERFFDESGGMQLVVHSPFGARINRAWGLALRKRFCRSFNFELQAAATEDAIVISLGHAHSFPLADVWSFLHPSSARDVLIQALLDAPMFQTRWRWNAARALAIPRFRGGKKVPPQLQRMFAEDLLASAFPDAAACLENIQGPRQIPDDPLVEQTIEDCLVEVTDIAGLEHVLQRILAGEPTLVERELTEPSPLAREVLAAGPYAFLDDVPLEERRTQAVIARRWLDPKDAATLGALDPAAIATVAEQAWPEARSADELHDALVTFGLFDPHEAAERGLTRWPAFMKALVDAGRAARVVLDDPSSATPSTSPQKSAPPQELVRWVATERLHLVLRLHPTARWTDRALPLVDPVTASERFAPEDALREFLRGQVHMRGPTRAGLYATQLGLTRADVDAGLLDLESRGVVMRGHYSPCEDDLDRDDPEWCERGLLARIHRLTLQRLRAEIEPVTQAEFMRFLFAWHALDGEPIAVGDDALLGVLARLEGFEAPASAWERELLPARMKAYDPRWLDAACLGGRVAWLRLSTPARSGTGRGESTPTKRGGPIKTTPITLVLRDHLGTWRRLAPARVETGELSSAARALHDILAARGASFFNELVERARLLRPQAEEALGELVAAGLVTADGFSGLRALVTPASAGSSRGVAAYKLEHAGRWSLLPDPTEDETDSLDAITRRDPAADLPASAADPEIVARLLLRRYGVVGKAFLARERVLPPWQALLRVFRTLEARGEIRGGRFVAGFTGEQFALPEAIATLRSVRRDGPTDRVVILSAADPLNLLGIVTPGERITASATARIAWLDGVPVAVREGSLTRWFGDAEARLSQELRRRIDAALVPSRVEVRRQVLASDTPSLAATGAMPRGRRPLRPLPGATH